MLCTGTRRNTCAMMTEPQPRKQTTDTIAASTSTMRMSAKIARTARIAEIRRFLIIKGLVSGSEVLDSSKEELHHHQIIPRRIPRMSGVILIPPCPALLPGAHPLSIGLKCLMAHYPNVF